MTQQVSSILPAESNRASDNSYSSAAQNLLYGIIYIVRVPGPATGGRLHGPFSFAPLQGIEATAALRDVHPARQPAFGVSPGPS
jgi:hypothetical protein